MNQEIESEINVDQSIYSQDRIKMKITSRLNQFNSLLKLDDYIDIEFYGYGKAKFNMFTMQVKDLSDILLKQSKKQNSIRKVEHWATFQS